jgi:hypothetical protein
MKKFAIYLMCALIFLCSSSEALAKRLNMTVELLEPFDMANPPNTLAVQTVGEHIFSTAEKIPSGTKIEGRVVKIVEPKRLKRDGYFYFEVTNLTRAERFFTPKNELVVKAQKHKPMNKKELAISAGTTVAGLFVDNIAIPINFVRGAANASEEQNPLAAGAQNAYENSILGWTLKGNRMLLLAGDKLTLVFRY